MVRQDLRQVNGRKSGGHRACVGPGRAAGAEWDMGGRGGGLLILRLDLPFRCRALKCPSGVARCQPDWGDLRSASSLRSQDSNDATVRPASAGWRSTLRGSISYVLARPTRVWER